LAEKEFDGQVAIVTGAAGGIGFSIARLLAMRGATACIFDIDGDGAKAARARLEGEGVAARDYTLDITDEAQVLAARDAVLGEFGQVDVLVNNAGLYPENTIRDMTEEIWDRVFDVNVKAPFFLMRALMDPMMARGYGRMVSIITIDAYMAKMTKPHYAASKAALMSLIKTFALELAPSGVLVNGVSPGAVATERAKKSDWLDEYIATTPVGYVAEPEDMAEYVLFLASTRNRFMTGETIIASGGVYMG
jgi:3-oxoacyl-[acyl-carrier protein] reductase